MLPDDRLDSAVILAGGLGSRLGSLTTSTPKPLVSVKGRPYLEYQLELLKSHGVSQIILLTGYLGDQIESRFGSGEALGLSITYSRETVPAGTGRALILSRHILPEQFFLVNGDTYVDVDYQAAYRAFRNLRGPGPAGLMVVCALEQENDEAGNVKLDPTGTRVVSYEKGRGGDYNHVDAGVLILSRSVIGWLPEDRSSALEEELFPRLAAEGRLLAFRSTAKFYDIGTPERLAAFERKLT